MNSPLSIKDYHDLAMRVGPTDSNEKIENGVLGLIGVSGSMVYLLKKHKYNNSAGVPFPMNVAIGKLGDILWHLEELADGLGTDMCSVSSLSFDKMDLMTRKVRPVPNLDRVILNLSSHANKIRKANDKNNRNEMELQMRRMLFCCAWLARIAEVPMSEVARRNIIKLEALYPYEFNAGTEHMTKPINK